METGDESNVKRTSTVLIEQSCRKGSDTCRAGTVEGVIGVQMGMAITINDKMAMESFGGIRRPQTTGETLGTPMVLHRIAQSSSIEAGVGPEKLGQCGWINGLTVCNQYVYLAGICPSDHVVMLIVWQNCCKKYNGIGSL